MNRMLLACLLLMTLVSPAFSAEPIADIDEYASMDELAAAFTKQFFGDEGAGAGAARGPAKKIAIAIIPVKNVRSTVVTGFARALEQSGRYAVLDMRKSAAFIKENPQDSPGLVSALRKEFNLDAVATIRTSTADGKMLVMTQLFAGDRLKTGSLFAALLDPAAISGTEATPAISSAAAENIPDLPFTVRLFDVADLDADGALEYVLSDGQTMHVYRLDAKGWHKVWTESESVSVKYLFLESADINGNGKPEIFTTVMIKGKASSIVFEEEKGTYKRIAVIPGFVRLLAYPGRGILLLVQNYDENRFFSGTPKQYTWSGREYVAGPEFPLPESVLLYGFEIADVGEAHPVLIANDDKNHLRVYSRESLIWESRERYGAMEIIAVESGKDAYAMQLQKSIKGRFFMNDLDGNGRDEVISPRNIGGSALTDPKEGEVLGMEWTGARLEQTFKHKVPGPILDIQLVRQGGAGAQLFVLVQTKGGFLKKPGSRLLSYTLR